jgi:hypothetical protein
MLVQVPDAPEAILQDGEPENQHKVPITIVTGYLGAGSKISNPTKRGPFRGAQQFSSPARQWPAPGNPGSPGIPGTQG